MFSLFFSLFYFACFCYVIFIIIIFFCFTRRYGKEPIMHYLKLVRCTIVKLHIFNYMKFQKKNKESQ